MSLFRKLFLDGEWTIAFRDKCEFLDCNKQFESIPNSKKYWFADPMLVENKNGVFLFCEAYDKNAEKGVIGVFTFNNGKFGDFRIVIEENYHMSYPCVFLYDNQYYMIPESGENNTLDLYYAVDFPYQWEKLTTLLNGKRYVDPTVYCSRDNKLLMYVYDEKDGYYGITFELDLQQRKIIEINRISYSMNEGRSAGYFFKLNDKMIKPVQDCREIYGKSIMFKDYEKEKDGKDSLVWLLDVSKIKISMNSKVNRIHTYSSSDNYEVIDYNILKFDIFKRFKLLRRKIKTRKRIQYNEKNRTCNTIS